jgi:Fis family transcriptional regulator, factor for inversion stimulation protein
MPGYRAEETERRPVNATTHFELSAVEQACVRQLVGHTLAVVEREFILQTLRHHRGNRTRAAERLRISIRSLRDRIRAYRFQGESVPEPESSYPGCRTEGAVTEVRH